MSRENQDFDESVDRWVFAAVSNGVTSFNSLLGSLPGVYPSVALLSLKRLISAGKISERFFSGETPKRRNNHQINRLQVRDNDINLPVPHPLDYDWRFSGSATKYLLDYCLEITKEDETIAFLGTPSLFQKAKEISFPRKTILLDNNSAVINYFSENIPEAKIKHCDILRDVIPELTALTVVADPPWYEKHLLGFLWTAAKICCLDGHIAVSLPPVGTRPGIESELERFFDWAKKLGLILVTTETSILPYNSPPFEINALNAENFYDSDREWRRGDLAVFVKREHTSVERPLILPESEEKWLEEIVQGVRVRLKPYDNLEFKDPKLLTLVKNDVFPSVSRREPRRPLVEVWTSGNRVYACEGRFILREILRELSSRQSAITVLSEKLNRKLTREEINRINESKKQMLKIINTEREENYVFANGNR